MKFGEKWKETCCGYCGEIIEEADSDIMYVGGYPVCAKCFGEIWEEKNKEVQKDA